MSAGAETRVREIEAQYEVRLATIARERDELKARAERAEHERNEFKKLSMLVSLDLERLKLQLFGKKAETVDPAQVQLASRRSSRRWSGRAAAARPRRARSGGSSRSCASAPRPRWPVARRRRSRPLRTAGAISPSKTFLSRTS